MSNLTRRLFLEGAVLVDQYCNPLADVTLESISAQLDDITEKVKKCLRVKNASHPSLRSGQSQFSPRLLGMHRHHRRADAVLYS